MDARFSTTDGKLAGMDAKFANIEVKFAEIDGKFRLLYWMLGIIIASTTLPALYNLLGG